MNKNYVPDPRDVLLDDLLWALNAILDDKVPQDLGRKREAWETVSRLHEHVMAWHRARARLVQTRLIPEQRGNLCLPAPREVLPPALTWPLGA